MTQTLESHAAADLEAVHEKLDRILNFLEQLSPYLPLLAKLAAFTDNPAARFRDMTMRRKGTRADG
jgi:hypothetical protein